MTATTLAVFVFVLVCLACTPTERPGEGSQAVLDSLRKHGADLSKPRHALFYLYFPSEASARQAADAVRRTEFGQQPQFKVSIERSQHQWLVLAEAQTIVDEPRIAVLDREFGKIAVEQGGEYDGWEAGLD